MSTQYVNKMRGFLSENSYAIALGIVIGSTMTTTWVYRSEIRDGIKTKIKKEDD